MGCPMCNGKGTQRVEKRMRVEEIKEVVVDESKPKTRIQLQFHDGTKKAEEFNCDHTVGDVRAVCMKHVGAPVKVKSGFPPKDLEDDTQTVEEAGLKGAQVRV